MSPLVEPHPKPDPVVKGERRGLRRARRRAWAQVAARLEVASAGLCQACDVHPLPACSGKYEHPHHVRPRGVGGLDVFTNALAVGEAHHRWIHEHPYEARALGLLR